MSFVWRASAHALATQMSHTLRSVHPPPPPVKECPTLRTQNGRTLRSSNRVHDKGRENKNVYRHQSPPLFSKKAMPRGKKWPVQMNLPFFAVKAYVPGGGSRIRPRKIRKMPSGRYRHKNLLFQKGGRSLRKDVFLPSMKTLSSKNPSKNLVFTEEPYRQHLRILLRSTRF